MGLRQSHAYPVRFRPRHEASTSGSSRTGMPCVVEQYIVNMMHVIHTHTYIYIYIYVYTVNKMNNYRKLKYLIYIYMYTCI